MKYCYLVPAVRAGAVVVGLSSGVGAVVAPEDVDPLLDWIHHGNMTVNHPGVAGPPLPAGAAGCDPAVSLVHSRAEMKCRAHNMLLSQLFGRHSSCKAPPPKGFGTEYQLSLCLYGIRVAFMAIKTKEKQERNAPRWCEQPL